MQLSLFASALWFWLAVIADRGAFRWRALFALLMTGKLFCLLGVLLVFAPRLLYGDQATGHSWHTPVTPHAFADQHLAGLLMLVVCPLTYVLAAVVIAAQGLRDLARVDSAPSNGRNIVTAP
jgi:putative membrane protein